MKLSTVDAHLLVKTVDFQMMYLLIYVFIRILCTFINGAYFDYGNCIKTIHQFEKLLEMVLG